MFLTNRHDLLSWVLCCFLQLEKPWPSCVCFVILPTVLSIQMRRNRLENGMRQNLSKGLTQALQRAFNDSNIRVQVCIACFLHVASRYMMIGCQILFLNHPSQWNREVKLHCGKAACKAYMKHTSYWSGSESYGDMHFQPLCARRNEK